MLVAGRVYVRLVVPELFTLDEPDNVALVAEETLVLPEVVPLVEDVLPDVVPLLACVSLVRPFVLAIDRPLVVPRVLPPVTEPRDSLGPLKVVLDLIVLSELLDTT